MNSFEQLPLKDIHLPDAVSWWPPAIGWWLLLAAVLLTALALWAWVRGLAKRRRRKKLYRLADEEINRIEAEYRSLQDSHAALQQLSVLLRRVSLSVCDRERIAGLCGQRWTDWLTRAVSAKAARSDVVQQLADGPYNPAAATELSSLFTYCRIWLRVITSKDAELRLEPSERGEAT